MNDFNFPRWKSNAGLTMAFALLCASMLTSCLNSADQPASESQVSEKATMTMDEGLQALQNRGYSKDQVVAVEGGFIVDGDMYFALEDLAKPQGLAKVAQRQSQAVTAGASLRLGIHSSASSYNTVIQQAVNNWNSLKTRLHIEIVSSGYPEIKVYADSSTSCPANMQNLSSITHAIGRVGSGGFAGSAICINMDNSSMLASERNRVSVLTHEIGHTIGFEHTGSASGTLIAGTVDTDAKSIMGSNGTVAQGIFTINDILALELIYPSDKPLGGTDLDGDRKDDLVVWRPSDGYWYALRSNNSFASGYYWQWGGRGDMPMADMDMDGDGIDDKVIWRPSDGYWHAVLSTNNSVRSIQFGKIGDIPLSNHDMDGDGKDDLVLWRWTEGKFYVLKSIGNYVTSVWYGWGTTGDIPVSGIDADKDGKDDWVFWRASEARFYVEFSGSNFTTATWYGWGQNGDIPVGSTDLDRDGKDDLMIWRPEDGKCWSRTSSSNLSSSQTLQWGTRGDVPVIGTDVDQDGKRDIVVWRPSTGAWHIIKSNANFTTSVSYIWGQ
jgi:hypothetical protein